MYMQYQSFFELTRCWLVNYMHCIMEMLRDSERGVGPQNWLTGPHAEYWNYMYASPMLERPFWSRGFLKKTLNTLRTQIPLSLTGYWAARFRLLFRYVAAASTSHQLIPLWLRASLNVDSQNFLGQPLFLPPPSVIHFVAWLACFSCGNRMTWPAIRTLLSAMMSCSLLWLARSRRFVTFEFGTRSFHNNLAQVASVKAV